MAKTDVQILISAKDFASPAFANLAKSANGAQIAVGKFGEVTSNTNKILTNMAGFAAAQMGVDSLSSAVHNTIGSMLDFYKTMQQGAIGTAGTLMSLARIDGRELGWDEALKTSTLLMRKMQEQAIATGVSSKSLISTFRASLPAAMQGGMKITDLLKVLGPLMAEGKLNHLDDATLVRDIRDILTGNNVTRTVLGQVLALDADKLKEAIKNGKEYEYLMQRLKGETKAISQYQNTWEGTMNHLKESVAMVGATALNDSFENIRNIIKDISNDLTVIDENGEVKVNPAPIEMLKQADEAIQKIIKGIKEVGQDFSFVTNIFTGGSGVITYALDHIREIIELLIAKMVAGKIMGIMNTIKGGLVGVGNQTTTLGKLSYGVGEAIRKNELAKKAAVEATNAELAKQAELNRQILNYSTHTFEATTGKRATRAAKSATNGGLVGDMSVTGGVYKVASSGEKGISKANGIANAYLSIGSAINAAGNGIQRQVVLTDSVNKNLSIQKALNAQNLELKSATFAKEAQYSAVIVGENRTSAEIQRQNIALGTALTEKAAQHLGQQISVNAELSKQNSHLMALSAAERRLTADEQQRNIQIKEGTAELGRQLAIASTRRIAANPAVVPVTYTIPQSGALQAVASKQNAANMAVAASAAAIGSAYVAASKAASLAGDNAIKRLNTLSEGTAANNTLVYKLGGTFTETGARGSSAMGKIIAMADKATIGAKGLLTAISGIAGGWIGVAITASLAATEQIMGMKRVNDYRKAHMFGPDNDKWAFDPDGTPAKMFNIPILGDIGFNKGDMDSLNGFVNALSNLNPVSGFARLFGKSPDLSGTELDSSKYDWEGKGQEAHDEWLKQAAEEEKKRREDYKKIADMLGDNTGALDPDKLGYGGEKNTEGEADAKKKEEKAAKKAAKNAKDYADAMGRNVNLITEANARMRDIVEGLKEKIAELKGSTYDKDIQAANKSYAETIKNITSTFKTLKSGPASGNVAPQQEGESNAMYAMKYLIANGLNEYGAAGIVGSLMHESAHDDENISPTALEEGGSGYGIAQWTDESRVQGLKDFAASMGTSIDDFNTQLGYIVKELRDSDLIDKLNNAGSVAEAAMIATDEYERPERGSEGQRVANANAIASKYEASKAGVPIVPNAAMTYTPQGVEEGVRYAKTLQQLQIEKAEKDLAERRRKQYSETRINYLTATGDRKGVLDAQYEEQKAEIRAKYDDIYKSIAGDTSSETERARARAEAEKAIQAMLMQAAQDNYTKRKELEDTEHQERMDHISVRADREKLTATEVQNLRAQELDEYIAMKQKELSMDQLTYAQRRDLEKKLNDAVKERNDIVNQRFHGFGETLKEQARQYSAETKSVITDGFNNIVSEFSNLGQNMITEHKSVAQRLKDLWKGVANDILNMAMKVAMNNAMQALFGRLFNFTGKSEGGTVGSAPLWNTAESFMPKLSLATGGHVTGPGTSTSDSIPTMLSNGEYVVKASAVRSVGTRFLDALNNGYISHFATGGMVGGRAAGSATAPNIKVNITNNTGNKASADVGDVKFDGESYIISVILNAYATNKNGFRSVMKGGA